MNQAEDNLLRELRENIEQDIEVYIEAHDVEHRGHEVSSTHSVDLCDIVMKRFREYSKQRE